ncbi:hypothetical protein BV22DRAFT_1135889, partial [Leucogyrophana mollusca]
AQDDEIKFLARKFCLTHSLWVPDEILLRKSPPNVDLLSKERWKSAKAIEDGLTAELWGFMPSQLHQFMGFDRFKGVFQHALTSARSSAVHEVKKSAGLAFNINPLVLSGNRLESPECLALIRGDDGEYTRFAPALFKDPKNCRPQDFLISDIMVRVLKLMIQGGSSLNRADKPNTGGARSKAKLWAIQSVTAGLIASSGVIAVFCLSADESFNPKGAQTGIDYRYYHNYFREHLLTSPSAQRIYTFYNNALFPGSCATTAHASTSAPSTWESRMEQLVAGFTLHEEPALGADTNNVTRTLYIIRLTGTSRELVSGG